jgi:hypothetical protein
MMRRVSFRLLQNISTHSSQPDLALGAVVLCRSAGGFGTESRTSELRGSLILKRERPGQAPSRFPCCFISIGLAWRSLFERSATSRPQFLSG